MPTQSEVTSRTNEQPVATGDKKRPDPTLRLYAVVRGDLEMPPGKMAAQSGHAFLEAYLKSARENNESAQAYAADPPGTKVVLCASSLEHIKEIERRANILGITTSLITDSGHVLPPHFDGGPVVTALGFGPATREEVRRITKGLALVP